MFHFCRAVSLYRKTRNIFLSGEKSPGGKGPSLFPEHSTAAPASADGKLTAGGSTAPGCGCGASCVLWLQCVPVSLPAGRGGQSALRFARLRMEKRHNYVRKVAETAVQLFISGDKVNVAGLVLAGSADFKTELSQSDMFDQVSVLCWARLPQGHCSPGELPCGTLLHRDGALKSFDQNSKCDVSKEVSHC